MRWRGHAGDIGKSGNADRCRRTEADGEGMAGGAAGGSWLRSPQLTGSQLLNSSAMASSLINWGKWIFGSLRRTFASLYPWPALSY
ncbi:hypothetical protein, partial [Blautia sp.]|uniref:hypothetical protein n=1 Tax=Blautia sp. TaxID=1955243 RepID=UPI003AF0CBFC